MTHEELLAIIDKHFYGRCFERCQEHMPWNALRAVVELHKPVINALPNKTCLACQDLYPCPTIQAIEKELK